jgi:hypothetical protein
MSWTSRGRTDLRRQFGTMTEKVAEYEKLLKDLITRVGDADANLIRASLEKVRGPHLGLVRNVMLNNLHRRHSMIPKNRPLIQ